MVNKSVNLNIRPCMAAIINICFAKMVPGFFDGVIHPALPAQSARWVDFVDVCAHDRSSILVAGGVRSLYLMSLIFASVLAWWALVIGCFSSIAFSEQAEALRSLPSESGLRLHIIIAVKSQGRKKDGVGDELEECERRERERARERGRRGKTGESSDSKGKSAEAKHRRFSQISAVEVFNGACSVYLVTCRWFLDHCQ